MSGPADQYLKEMKNRFKFYATWTPGEPLELGDIGILDDNEFIRKTSLKEEGFKDFKIWLDKTNEQLKHKSIGGITTTFKISGNVAPIGSIFSIEDAGFIFEFSDKDLTVFEAIGVKTHSIENQVEIGREILRRYEADDDSWDKDWVVITHLKTAASASVIISNEKKAKIEVKANANIKDGITTIADPKFQFSTIVDRGLETQIIADEGLTPLFRIIGIKTNIFGGNPSVENRFAKTGFDLLTPANAKKEFKDNIFVGYISDDVRE